ncbi:Ig-like domain-containing protein [Gordonia malaquae]|uniref:Ig-like domain-containing protein n=1 Tax=Gordonia TaxID=2053 RepID=UPI0030C79F18
MTRSLGRVAAATGTGLLVVAGLIASTPGVAAAAPATIEWSDGNTAFSRTVSDVNPAIGDTITVSTTFQRKWSFEDVYNFKDLEDGCLDYVQGSAKWEDSATTNVQVSTAAAGQLGFVRLESPNLTSWRVPGVGAGWGAKRTISLKYKVGENCPTGVNLAVGTMHYGGSLGSGTYQDKGPNIKVQTPPQKDATTTAVSVSPAPKVGDPSTVTAKITSTATVADGTVEFFNHNVSLGTANVVAGKATVSWTPSNEGAYSLKAVYSGTATLAGSSSSIGGTVSPKDPDPEPGAPIVTLSAAPKVGDAVTVTVESDAAVGASVALTANGTAICQNLTLGADHKATCQWTPSASGAVALKATIGAQSTTKNVTVTAKDVPVDPTDTTDPTTPTTTKPTTTAPGGNGSSAGSLSDIFGS